MIIDINRFVAFEYSDSIVSLDLDANPLLYLYEFGNYKQLVFADSQINSRINSFSIGLGSRLLNLVPSFLPDTLVRPDYHNTSSIPYVFGNVLPIMQYRKCRLLFVAGFDYNTEFIAQTLRITNGKTDILALFDHSATSNITILDKTIFRNNKIFTQAIEFNLIDLDYLYSTSEPKLVDIRKRLFGIEDIKPTSLHLAYNQLSESDIDLLDQSIIVNSALTTYRTLNFSDIDDNLTILITPSNENIKLELNHTLNYDIKYIISKLLQLTNENNLSISYNIIIQFFDGSNINIGTTGYLISNSIDMYQPIFYVPSILNNSVSFDLTVTATIKNYENGFTITKTSQLNNMQASKYIIDTNPQTLELNVVNPNITIVKEVKNITTRRNDINIVYM